jgi:hypothetical protein
MLVIAAIMFAVVSQATRGRATAGVASGTQKAQRDRYVNVIAPDMDATQIRLRAMPQPCETQFNRMTCRASAQGALKETVHMQADLDRTPAPDCLKLSDAELRFALEAFREGELLIISAIDNDLQASMNAGINKINEGSTHLDTSFALGKQAYCSPDR